jgi:hypothetical protein
VSDLGSLLALIVLGLFGALLLFAAWLAFSKRRRKEMQQGGDIGNPHYF